MKLPVYNFYIGESVQYIVWMPGIEISETTGDEGPGQSIVSSSDFIEVKRNIKDTIYLHLDYATAEADGKLYQYDADYNFIGYKDLTDSRPLPENIIELEKEAKYIRLSFFNNTDEYVKIKESTIFLYFMHRAEPVYKDLTKKIAQESGQMFFRSSLSGTIKFLGQDARYILGKDFNTKFLFACIKYNTAKRKDVMYYRGTFTKANCEVDFGKTIVQPTLTVLDEYTDVLANYDKTYNILDIGVATEAVKVANRPALQLYVAGEDTITTYIGNSYWETDVDDAQDKDDDLSKKYRFALIGIANEFEIITPGAGVQFHELYSGINGDYTSYIQREGMDSVFAGKVRFVKKYSRGDIVDSDLTGINVETGKWESIVHDYDGDIENPAEHFMLDYDAYYIEAKSVGSADVFTSEDLYFQQENRGIYFTPAIKAINLKAPWGDIITRELSNVVSYKIFSRMLTNVEVFGDKNTDEFPLDDFTGTNSNRVYKRCIGFDPTYLFASSFAVKEPTKYGKNDYGLYFTDSFISDTLGLNKPMPICRSGWANTSLWMVLQDTYYDLVEKKGTTYYTFKDAYPLDKVISALLRKVAPYITFKASAEYSTFLYDKSSTYANNVANLFGIFLTQKTNILKGNYDAAAKKAETTLKAIMTLISNCFKCYWFVEDGKLRVENIEYFKRGGGYGANARSDWYIEKEIDIFNGQNYAYVQEEVKYKGDGLASRYEFEFTENRNPVFGSLAIDVKDVFVEQGKTEKISISDAASDIDGMLIEPGQFNDDGFALLCCEYNSSEGKWEVPVVKVNNLIDENDRQYSAVVQNYYASWPYLARFYMYDISGSSLRYDKMSAGYSAVILSDKFSMDFSIPMEEDINPYTQVILPHVTGHVSEISISMNTRLAKVSVEG